ncbi:pyridoxal phosphate phosphatase PHOSPHO2-like [Haliotis rubra]|uniref:pyridoxal phosphate phosphatase PHOSPHO2-like n=1 Tax=Haliotis rubra TaxID=36100 RepID=UPI001EE62D3C|nr:pyridoxal phosphate phosphatase PHOSPHO2-like [Haliotis rubra]
MMGEKILLALDFDHTLIDENSDLFVIRLAPNGELPQEIKGFYSDNGWIEYMGEIFKFLHVHGVKPDNFKECLSSIPLTLGMEELFAFIKESDKFETVIISDSNSIFIDTILEKFGLKDTVTQVFTNPAMFDQNGLLTIQYYHTQDWCSLSTVNLCKGHILQEFIKERKQKGVTFSTVIYIGDGSNDLCPGLSLSQQDYLCPRVGFSLWRKVNKLMKEDQTTKSLKARIYPWESGSDIVGLIKNISP